MEVTKTHTCTMHPVVSSDKQDALSVECIGQTENWNLFYQWLKISFYEKYYYGLFFNNVVCFM